MKKFNDGDFEKVIEVIKDFMDFHPENYKVKPLARRVRSRMRRVGVEDYNDYAVLLRRSKGEKDKLKDALTINLTSFFRNKTVFETLKTEILPYFKDPAIWSAGCSNGAEPYALAILCKELDMNCSILGTDIDKESIKEACEGIYDEMSVKELPSYYKLKYFEKVDGGYKVIKEIRDSVAFRNIDLKHVNYKNRFDLVVCRNVLIYMKKEFQRSILESFSSALKKNGYLVLGKVESIPNDVRSIYKPVSIRDRIYAKS